MDKATKIPRGQTIDASKYAPGFVLQTDFSFFTVESICGFTSNFVAICSDTLYPFGFISRRKRPPIDILKLIVTTLSNQDNKVAFIQVDEYGSLSRYSEFMKICQNITIIVQTTNGDVSSLNGKIEIPNKTLPNTTRDLLAN